MQKPTYIYALMVAINKYPDAKNQLAGCVNDILAMEEYLSTFQSESCHIIYKVLLNEAATRENIINGFEHFDQAVDGDICLFNYSGHGSRYTSPAAFSQWETDGMNETIVCYDSRCIGGMDLLDKELSYLIWKATTKKEVYFLALMDCCHSGSNIRESLVRSRNYSVPGNNDRRPEDYLGFKHYQQLANAQLTPPSGRYVALAACRDSETAKEAYVGGKPRGMFTYCIIEALKQSNNQLSYAELINKVKLRIKNKVSDQSPQLDASLTRDKNLFFLSNSISTKNSSFINSLQLLPPLPFTITFAEDNDIDGEQLIRDILPDKKSAFFQLVKTPKKTMFLIHAKNDSFYFTRQADYHPTINNNPKTLFKKIEPFSKTAALELLYQIEKAFRWMQIIELNNPFTSISNKEIGIDLLRSLKPGQEDNDTPMEEIDWHNPGRFNYQEKGTKWSRPAFQIKIKNTGNRTLWISLIYFSGNYSIDNILISKQALKAGEEVWASYIKNGYRNKTIPIHIDDTYHRLNIDTIFAYLKLMICTEEFSTDHFNQKGLEYNQALSRTAQHPTYIKTFDQPDWTSKEIILEIHRPRN